MAPHADPAPALFRELMEALAEESGECYCPACGAELCYFKARFWIAGKEKAWNIRVPVCLNCES